MLEVKTNRRVSGNGILIFFRITDSLLKVRMLELNGAASTGRNTPKTPTGVQSQFKLSWKYGNRRATGS